MNNNRNNNNILYSDVFIDATSWDTKFIVFSYCQNERRIFYLTDKGILQRCRISSLSTYSDRVRPRIPILTITSNNKIREIKEPIEGNQNA